ncbi:MAG TPA: GNAT family N-acetyltransferase [Candidatus Limnocylindrales bacterium]|jgi:predicted acetyltransferase
MTIEIRTATPDEYEAVLDVTSIAFLDRVDVAAIAAQARDVWVPERSWAAWDGGRVCGAFRSWPTQLTVPGLATLPGSAIVGVTVLPTHRRRGILTRLAAAEHDALVARGEAAGLLYASEYPIYGRFGYGAATRFATWTVDRMRTRVLPPPPDTGTLELVTPTPAIGDEIRALYDAWRLGRPGEIARRRYSWDVLLGLVPDAWSSQPFKGFFALHRDAAGQLDGFIRYKANATWTDNLPRNELEITDLFGRTEDVERVLWAFLGSVDLVTVLKAEGRSPSDRLPWLLANPRGAVQTGLADGMWVRIFDLERALAARTYEHRGELVLEVLDDRAVGGRVRVRLDGGPDGATCVATDADPDLTLPVAALGSVYLGAHDLRDVAVRSGADEHRAGALARAAAMFRTAREPWTSTFF